MMDAKAYAYEGVATNARKLESVIDALRSGHINEKQAIESITRYRDILDRRINTIKQLS